MSHVFPVHNVFREDVVTNGDGGEDTLANAPERREPGICCTKDRRSVKEAAEDEFVITDSSRAWKENQSP